MSKRFKLSSLFAALLVAALVLSACSPFGGGKQGGSGGQVLNLMERDEPPNLDSAKSTDAISFTILANVEEGLYRLDKDGKPVLGMAAAEPQVSPDKKTYTFKLRDAKWSDGKPVTAHDFEYAWKRALDPKTASEYAYILYPVLNAEKYNTGGGKADDVGVKALDDKTLEVKLERPIPFLNYLLAFPTYLPQRKDIVEKYGEKYALEASNMVFNGPYVLSEWKHNQSFTYKKNDNYWNKDNVKLDTVKVQIVKDAGTALNLYKTGKLDYTTLGSDFIDAYKNSPERVAYFDSSVWYLEMNQTKAFFKNQKIRKAIAEAIDKKTFTDKLLKDGSEPAGALVPPQIYVQGKEFRSIATANVQFNPTEAKQLLQQGLKELGMSSAPSIELLSSDTTTAKRDAQFVQNQLQTNLGLKVTVAPVPFKERLKRTKEGNFDIALMGWSADYNDPMTYLDLFMSDNPQNRGKYSNPQYDALIKKSKENPNFEERAKDLVKAEQMIMDDAGVAPLYYRKMNVLVKPYVKDLSFNAIGPEYSLEYAHIEGK
jgi:oligopeptide transport system substrate-binding protein